MDTRHRDLFSEKQVSGPLSRPFRLHRGTDKDDRTNGASGRTGQKAPGVVSVRSGSNGTGSRWTQSFVGFVFAFESFVSHNLVKGKRGRISNRAEQGIDFDSCFIRHSKTREWQAEEKEEDMDRRIRRLMTEKYEGIRDEYRRKYAEVFGPDYSKTYADGYAKAFMEGFGEGFCLSIIEQIREKIRKGVSLDQCAGLMGMDPEEICPIWEAVLAMGEDADPEAVLEALKSQGACDCFL